MKTILANHSRPDAHLISTDGEEVKTIEEYSHNFKADIVELPSGLYVLQLIGDGIILNEKL